MQGNDAVDTTVASDLLEADACRSSSSRTLLRSGDAPWVACSTSAGPSSLEHLRDALVLRGWHTVHHDIVALEQRVTIRRSRLEPDAGMQRLSTLEFQVARLASLGFASKGTACELLMQPGAVRAALSRVLRKLGLRSYTQIPAFWQCVRQGSRLVESQLHTNLESVVFESALTIFEPQEAMTLAERSILLAVIAGHNNLEIASHRGTSPRTIANQLALLFRKFRVASKGELAATGFSWRRRGHDNMTMVIGGCAD